MKPHSSAHISCSQSHLLNCLLISHLTAINPFHGQDPLHRENQEVSGTTDHMYMFTHLAGEIPVDLGNIYVLHVRQLFSTPLLVVTLVNKIQFLSKSVF